jgi:hypothetical protein
MKRTIWGVWALTAIGLGGCSMCQSPYDYQGPVASSPAAYGPRAGSAFGGATMGPQAMGMAAAPEGQTATTDPNASMTPMANSQTPPAQRY